MVIRFQYITALILSAQAFASQPGSFEKKEFRAPSGDRLHYRFFRPTPVSGGAKYPFVIWLHDILGVGGDNRKQITGTNAPGAVVWTKQDRYPGYVAAPQCPLGSLWVNAITKAPSGQLRLVPELIEELVRDYPIDPDRIYLVGQSMGGYAAWALMAMRPDLFAAAIPVAGGGRPGSASAIAKIPVWVFHGKRDLLAPVSESRRMIRALKDAGGDPRYTEYPTLGHTRTFWNAVFSNPELPAWLFSQTRP